MLRSIFGTSTMQILTVDTHDVFEVQEGVFL